MPRVSVLMPAYNAEKYLKDAIESILSQQFTDFEFLIINDGSTDNSAAIIQSYNDPRIRMIHNCTNLGLIESLNKGIDLAQGEYIARMDSDDISLPERFARQVSFMDKYTEVGLCGTWVMTIGDQKGIIMKFPLDDPEIRCNLFFKNKAFAHPSVVFRKNLLNQLNIRYNLNFKYAEDYELWVRCLNYTRLANISEVLLKYRLHESNTNKRSPVEQQHILNQIRLIQLAYLKIYPTDDEIKLHQSICNMEFAPSKNFIKSADSWIQKIKSANDKLAVYPELIFSKMLGERWFGICTRSGALGLWVFKSFWQSPLSRYLKFTFHQQTKFAVKCAVRWSSPEETAN